jgi:branched-chain amino acid transport system permease protein
MGYLLTTICQYFETLIGVTGVHLSLSVGGIFFLGFPVTFASGAYAMVIFEKQGLPLYLAVTISMIIALLIGFIFALAYIKLSNDSFTILTLASILACDAVLKSWDNVTGGVLGISGISRPDFLSSLPALAIGQSIVAFVIIILEYILLKTSFGRSLLAMKENKASLNSLGSSDHKIGFTIVMIVSILAAVEGMFSIWRIQFLDPSFAGIMILIKMLTVAIIAYKPRVLWLVLSALFIVMLPEALRFFHLSSVIMGQMRILIYALLVIFLIRNLSGRSLQTNRSF